MAKTKDEFERDYARKSGLTLQELREYGGRAIPCDCPEDDCPGWEMCFSLKPPPVVVQGGIEGKDGEHILIEGIAGRGGAAGGDVIIGPGNYRAGRGGSLTFKGGDA